MDEIRILIAGKLPLTTDALNRLVRFESEMEVVGIAESGEQAGQRAQDSDPQVALLGVPDMRGIDLAPKIHEANHLVRVILLALSRTTLLREAMKRGISDVTSSPQDAEITTAEHTQAYVADHERGL